MGLILGTNQASVFFSKEKFHTLQSQVHTLLSRIHLALRFAKFSVRPRQFNIMLQLQSIQSLDSLICLAEGLVALESVSGDRNPIFLLKDPHNGCHPVELGT